MIELGKKSSELESMIGYIRAKMDFVRKQRKEDILRAFNNATDFYALFEKLENNEIITKAEKETLYQFGYASEFVDPEMDKEKKVTLLNELRGFIADYPYVLNVNHIIPSPTSGHDGVMETIRGDKKGLVQKIPNENDDGYEINRLLDEDYVDINYRDNDTYKLILLTKDDGKQYFVRLAQVEASKKYTIETIDMDKYFRIGHFDHDNIAFVSNTPWGKLDCERGLIRRIVNSEKNIYITQLPRMDIKFPSLNIGDHWPVFDSYNQVHGQIPGVGDVVLRKKFQGGKCIGVDFFKKLPSGKEGLIS